MYCPVSFFVPIAREWLRNKRYIQRVRPLPFRPHKVHALLLSFSPFVVHNKSIRST
ncbi:hypothetical protein BC827DRAFT_1365256, partial [Russula dissimulans]